MAERLGRREYARIVARVWADPDFRERLRASPVEVLKSEEGIHVPAGTKVVDFSVDLPQAEFYLLLPAKPPSLDEELVELALVRLGENDIYPCICWGAEKPVIDRQT